MLFHGDCFHISMHFLKYCRGNASAKMHFFTSRNAFQMLFHVVVYHSNAFFSNIVGEMPRQKCIFSLPEMHSKCSFMVTVSTFKCIFLKHCRANASAKIHFFTSRNAFQMLFHVVVSPFKCIFLKHCWANASAKMHFFHFQKCIPNALSWWLFPHSNAFFQLLFDLLLQLNCIFFTSANAFQTLIHGDYFHNVRLHTSVARECAHSRV